MYQSLKVYTPPVKYPVEPEQAFDALKIDEPSTTLQAQRIETFIAAATNLVEHYTGRSLLTQRLCYVLPEECMRTDPRA